MENLSRKEIVKKAFDQMPRSFTSHEFVEKLIELGVERHKLYLYNYLEFLKNNCVRDSKKSWRKVPPTMNEQMESHRDQFRPTTIGAIFNSPAQQLGIGTTPVDYQLEKEGDLTYNPKIHGQVITSGSQPLRIRTTPIPEGSTVLPGSVVGSTGTYSAIISLEKRIEEAISLLKTNGYKVQKIVLQDV